MRKIPFSKIVCDGQELANIQQVIESGWLTTGSRALEFEQRFAEAVTAKYACAVNSCTAAMHLALEAIGIVPGDQVIVPTWTFTATAEVVRYLGADPLLVDCEYASGLVNPQQVAEALEQNPRAKAVLIVHFGGQSAHRSNVNGSGIQDICTARGIRLIEDAAHAFPTRHNGRMIGSVGDITCFSFYANKTITTGEGGMLTTNDEALASRAKVMRLHGIDRDVWSRFTSVKASWEYDVVAPGFNNNMPDLNAAIGLAQLERAERMREERQRCAEFYLTKLSGLSCLDLPPTYGAFGDHAWHLFPIVLKPDARLDRNSFIRLMAERGVGTSVHYKPIHRMTYYRDRYNLRPDDFPNAERRWQGCVSLPIYPSLTSEELEYIVSCIDSLLAN